MRMIYKRQFVIDSTPDKNLQVTVLMYSQIRINDNRQL